MRVAPLPETIPQTNCVCVLWFMSSVSTVISPWSHLHVFTSQCTTADLFVSISMSFDIVPSTLCPLPYAISMLSVRIVLVLVYHMSVHLASIWRVIIFMYVLPLEHMFSMSFLHFLNVYFEHFSTAPRHVFSKVAIFSLPRPRSCICLSCVNIEMNEP